jgi:hypothetical protein
MRRDAQLHPTQPLTPVVAATTAPARSTSGRLPTGIGDIQTLSRERRAVLHFSASQSRSLPARRVQALPASH